MKLSTTIWMGFALLCILWTACDPKEPDTPNEEEIITNVNYTLTPEGGGEAVSLIYSDIDGDGEMMPVITNGTLKANTTYMGEISLLNEQGATTEDIGEEVKDEDEDHQFFFINTVDGLSILYNDKDENENPVGLLTTLQTENVAKGDLTIILRHQPDKNATGVKDGDSTNAGGSTDLEVTFEVTVE